MTVWLRQGTEILRLDLIARWGRPPVVAPQRRQRRELIQAASRVEPRRMGGTEPLAKLDKLLATDRDAGPFREKAGRATSVCLSIPDATRLGPWEAWVVPVIGWITAQTPSASRRTLLVASGLHRPDVPPGVVSEDGWEVRTNGDEQYRRHRFVGETPAGTPVRLHPDWLDADLRIALGDVTYHYFAGFGGGRKLIFPGLGEPDGIRLNHRRCLTQDGSLDTRSAPGRLEGNPVHEDLVEAAALCPPDLLIQLVEPGVGHRSCVMLGDWKVIHSAGCRLYNTGHQLEHTCRPDLLIADAGGWPRDATFLQAHKSLQHAARFLAPGGRLLLIAGLDEGIGSEVLETIWHLPLSDLRERARAEYQLHTHTALAFREVCERIEVAVWSRLEPERIRRAGLVPIGSRNEAVDWLEAKGRPRRWGWLTRAEVLLPRWVGSRPARLQNDPISESDHGEAHR